MPRYIVLERVATGYRQTESVAPAGSVFGRVSAKEVPRSRASLGVGWRRGRVSRGVGVDVGEWRTSLMWVGDAGARGLLLACLDASMDHGWTLAGLEACKIVGVGGLSTWNWRLLYWIPCSHPPHLHAPIPNPDPVDIAFLFPCRFRWEEKSFFSSRVLTNKRPCFSSSSSLLRRLHFQSLGS